LKETQAAKTLINDEATVAEPMPIISANESARRWFMIENKLEDAGAVKLMDHLKTFPQSIGAANP